MILTTALLLAGLPSSPGALRSNDFAHTPFPHPAEVVVLAGSRATGATVFGFDYEFDDGIGAVDTSSELSGPWTSDLSARLIDWWGYGVGEGRAFQESTVSSTQFDCDLLVSATTDGNHFSADSMGETEYVVDFRVDRTVRFQVSASAGTSVGYNEASATLKRGDQELFSVYALAGDADTASTSGWLQPGDHRIEAHAECFAYGTHGSPDSQGAGLDTSLTISPAGDYDDDGVVELEDLVRFSSDHQAQDPKTDFDGDGLVTEGDKRAFRAVWRSGR